MKHLLSLILLSLLAAPAQAAGTPIKAPRACRPSWSGPVQQSYVTQSNNVEMDTRTKIVDCTGVRSEQEFWAAYVRDVKPESPHFGRNFYAFRDALWGGAGWPDADELRFIHTSSLVPLRDGEFIDILREIAQGIDSVRLVFE